MFRLLSIIVSPISRRLHDTCDEVSSLLSTTMRDAKYCLCSRFAETVLRLPLETQPG